MKLFVTFCLNGKFYIARVEVSKRAVLGPRFMHDVKSVAWLV